MRSTDRWDGSKKGFGVFATGKFWGEVFAALALFVALALVWGLYNFLTYCQ